MSVASESSSAGAGTPFGRYLLLRRLNIGGMAEVHLAKALGMHGVERLVAIKRILPGVAEDPEFVRMFVDEAKLSVQLSHAGIAQTLELGRIGRTLFIAMEYVSGVDARQLWDFAQLGGELPLAAIVYLMAKLCEGLDYAHRKTDEAGRPLGIVHRDISPQNVMIAFDGQVKIIDFGIAKAKVRASQTRVGILKGKFAYMSPEQVAGTDLDGRSDVFAAGIILYEMLTRTRLFKSESDFATLEKVRHAELFPPSLVRPGMPKELEQIVLKTLQRDREQRTASAEALHQMLMRFAIQTGETFSARDMQGLLARSFPKELEKERQRLLAVAEIHAPSGATVTQAMIEEDTDKNAREETFAAMPGVFTSEAQTQILSTESIALNDRTQIAETVEATRMLESGPHPEATRIVLTEPSRSAARLRSMHFSRESVVLWAATAIAALLVLAAFWASSRVTASAHLAIDAEPLAAQLLINGRAPAVAASSYEVPPGELLVEVRADGYCPWARRLTLQPGEGFSTHVVLSKVGAGCR